MVNIISNLVKADWNYGKGLNPYILNSFLEIFDRFPDQLGPVEKQLSRVEQYFIDQMMPRLEPHVHEAIRIAENADTIDCVDDGLALLGVNGIIDAEYPFFKYITENTYLKDSL